MGKSRDLFKKIEMSREYSCKKGTIKDRNVKDLLKAEDIKKKWQEYTEELCKNGFNDPDNHNGVVTHLDLTSWSVKLDGP